MASSDHTEILEILEGLDIMNPSSYEQYAKMDWLWKDDQNNINYNSSTTPVTSNTATVFPQINQIIRLDTKDLIDYWVGYKQAFWFVPFTYTLGGTIGGQAYNAPASSNGLTPYAVVGIKNGLYQLVDGLQISINGVQLNKLNSKYLNMVNQWHAMIDSSMDYCNSVGQFNGCAKDTLAQMINSPANINTTFPFSSSAVPYASNAYGSVQSNAYNIAYNKDTGNDATEFATINIAFGNGSALGVTGGTGITGSAAILTVTGQPGTGQSSTQLLAQKNKNFNKGFLDRINFTNMSYSVTSNVGTGTFNACIPLRILNDFFRSLNMPLLGTQFFFQFTLASPSLSATQPFMVDKSACTVTAVGGLAYTVADTLSVTVGNGTLSNTRLYYPRIQFNAQTLAKVNSLLASGFQRSVVWYDNYVVQGNLNLTSGSPNFQITPGISRPVRVIMMTPRSAPAQSSTVPANSAGINSAYDAAPSFSVGQFTNLQLLVDTVPLFPNPLIYDIEAYNLLKEEFIGHGRDQQDGSLISFKDFITQYRYYVFNCSRMINSLPDPSKSVSLQFIANRVGSDSVAVDQYFLIEVEQSTIINFSSSKTVTI